METRQAHSVILSMLLVRQRLVTIITYGFFARNVTTSNSFARFLRGREAYFHPIRLTSAFPLSFYLIRETYLLVSLEGDP